MKSTCVLHQFVFRVVCLLFRFLDVLRTCLRYIRLILPDKQVDITAGICFFFNSVWSFSSVL